MRTRTRGVGPWALVCAVLLACTPPAGAPTQPPTVGGLTPAPTAAAPPTSPAPIATRRPTDDLPDPGAPGPYAVGATRRTTARTLANGDRRGIGLEVSYPALPADPLMGNLTGPPALAGPHPVVVFSHGHGAQPHHYRPAIEHLASHGFVVVAPVHNDCVNCLGEDQLLGQNLRRTGDVSAALDAVLALSAGDDGILRGVADPVRVGVAGHSRGGYTTLRALEEDDRLLAGLALAPSTWGGRATAAPDPARVARPLMIIQGEWDAQVPYDGVAEFFERIPATAPNRWFVGFPRTGHAFWDECVDGRMSVRPCSAMLAADQVGRAAKRWGTAFLLRHVAGDVRYDPLLDPAAAAGAEYSVYLAAAGSSAPLLPRPAPPAGGEGTAAEAIDLICRSGRKAPCELLRARRVAIRFAVEGNQSPSFALTPGLITLYASQDGPPAETASLLIGAVTYFVLGAELTASCADVARVETEQALFWTWLYPSGQYPTESPRARRMLEIVRALGPDGVVLPHLDPLRASSCPPATTKP